LKQQDILMKRIEEAEKKAADAQNMLEQQCKASAEREKQLRDDLSKERVSSEKQLTQLQEDLTQAQKELTAVTQSKEKMKALGAKAEQVRTEMVGRARQAEVSSTAEQVTLKKRIGDLEDHAVLHAQQEERSRQERAMLESEIKAKALQLRDTMEFNKKSMAITAKLSETVKLQEKEISELKWLKSKLEGELRLRSEKVETLAAVVKTLREAAHEHQEDNEQGGGIHGHQSIRSLVLALEHVTSEQRVAHSALRIGKAARDYLLQMERAPGSSKRKLNDQAANQGCDVTEPSAKKPLVQDLRGQTILTDLIPNKKELVVAQQGLGNTKFKARQNAQMAYNHAMLRKGCLQARATIFTEQLMVIEKLLAESNIECRTLEDAFRLVDEEYRLSSSQLEGTKLVLNNVQLLSMEMEIESNIKGRARPADVSSVADNHKYP